MNIKNSKLHVNTINRKKIFFLLMTISLFLPTAHADDFWYGGRLKVGTGTYIDRLDDSSNGAGPSQFVFRITS